MRLARLVNFTETICVFFSVILCLVVFCRLYKANGRGRAFGTPCEVGDRVGCGIKFEQLLQDEEAFRHVVPVFFTKNGKEVI